MLRKNSSGLLELLLGIVFIIIGIVSFTNPSTALGGLVVVYGIVALITGIVDIVLYVKLERRTGFGPVVSLVGGIFSVLAGILLLFNIDAGKWVLSILFPIWFIAHCISRLATLNFTRLAGGKALFWFSLIINIIGLVLGFMLLFRPAASALSVSYILGAYFIVLGVGNIAGAFSRFSSR